MNKTKLVAFDLERWQKGNCKVVTKSGKEVSDLTYFGSATKETFPLVGVLENDVQSWTINGGFSINKRDSVLDLLLEVEDKTLEGWVNVFKDDLGCTVFSSKEWAMKYAYEPNYVTTIKITYNDNDR